MKLPLKKCGNRGESLGALCLIWPAQGLNLRPPAPVSTFTQIMGVFIKFRLSKVTTTILHKTLVDAKIASDAELAILD